MRVSLLICRAAAMAAAFVLCWWLPGPIAVAKDTDTTLAEALFRDGRKLLKAGKAQEACPKFEESYRLVPKLGTLLNLATCHATEGKTGSAWGEFTKAASLAHRAGNQDREEYARKQLAELDAKLSKLVVKVPHAVEGIEVRIDDTVIGKAVWDTPVPQDPGDHQIEVTAPGKKPWSKTVTIPEGPNVLSVHVPELVAGEAADATAPDERPVGPPDEPVEPDDGSTQRAFGWIVGGIGLVGLGVGAGFGVNTFIKQGDSDDHCVETLCDQEGVDLRDEAQTSATISTIAFAVGLAATGTAIILLLTAPDGEEGVDQESARRWWIAPGVGPSSGAVEVGVWW